jgi:hypothetical protein
MDHLPGALAGSVGSNRGNCGRATRSAKAAQNSRSASQLDAVGEAFGCKLEPEDYQEVDKILADTIKDPVGPDFMAPALS